MLERLLFFAASFRPSQYPLRLLQARTRLFHPFALLLSLLPRIHFHIPAT